MIKSVVYQFFRIRTVSESTIIHFPTLTNSFPLNECLGHIASKDF